MSGAPHPSPALRTFVEQRFPLQLSPQISQIRALYDAGKAGRWNPQRDVPWQDLQVSNYPAELQAAMRLCWSRRAWVEATGLTETPALLVRFCMEAGRESDPKFFLAVRNTEEAWHVESFDHLAELFGGRIERPANPAYEFVFNRGLHRKALSADEPLDIFVAVHAAFEDGLELELFRAFRAATADPTINTLLDRVVVDKDRHAAFGWAYLEHRAPSWSSSVRDGIGRALVRHIHDVELQGLHCPWMARELAGTEAAADAMVANAGLGALRETEEAELFVSYVAACRRRLAEFSVDLPLFHTNRLRPF